MSISATSALKTPPRGVFISLSLCSLSLCLLLLVCMGLADVQAATACLP
ncbi:hypothetical protein LRB11_03725 [Ectothiorhodospira haloalkaliphila]|nr:hypothetical protein [Ectothiorhodospira haloalkaliphila]MCG5524040.1 hypothetical protein [Ectothiorhodospira haloalkaliphila]